MTHNGHDIDALLFAMFKTAISAVSAENTLRQRLPESPRGRTVLLAVGKAASSMAKVALQNWNTPISGLVVTRYGHVDPDFVSHPDIDVLEAAHPVPDQNSVAGALRALELVSNLSSDDLVLVLVSGGGSSLWCAPIDGISLDQKRQVTNELLMSGASIQELNTVRKWLSRIKGGRLAAAAYPARVETLIISDVVSDDPSMIASGPSIIQPTSYAEFERIVRRYNIQIPDAVLEAASRCPPPAMPDEAVNHRHQLIAVPKDALNAADNYARALGYEIVMLGDGIEGDARQAAKQHAEIALKIREAGKPTVILSGGEVTVDVRNRQGTGGPNTEFLLSLALHLEESQQIFALACDTDGFDGVADCAGAIVRPDTLLRARQLNLDPEVELNNNNSSYFFGKLDDLVRTGPTQTNVSDFRAIVVNPEHTA